MSSHAKPPELSTAQQTLHEAVNARRIYQHIRGIHPRVELPHEAYEEWLDGNRGVEYVIINFSDADEVIERDGDLSQVLEPWHIPVVLGTEHDGVLNERTFQDIVDLLKIVQPAIYVPDVVYSYNWMDDEIQEYAIEAYTSHVRSLQQEIIEQDFDIRLLPTNKGWKYDHFVEYRDLWDEFDYTEFAFYAVQYTGGDAGNAINVLQSHVRNVISALDPDDVFLIGRLAEDDLFGFAPRVCGATGLRQWKRACRTEDGFSQNLWSEFQENRRAKLAFTDDQEQRPLTDFSDETEDT
ncbi:hypothetical protein [Halohasta litorea]|uniref:Uncharacterized protein n=1 Tax=Halohasta litorea TaxID=869891 RepID=A0ABD6D7Q3_9EURY|nr:hypothetical protein [Halohasta litorea]